MESERIRAVAIRRAQKIGFTFTSAIYHLANGITVLFIVQAVTILCVFEGGGDGFRAGILRSAEVQWIFSNSACKTKISDLEGLAVLIEQDVASFDVVVTDACRVDMLQTVNRFIRHEL